MRKKIIAANWKMYKTQAEAQRFMAELLPLAGEQDRDLVVIFPPFTCLQQVIESARGSKVKVGGQNIFWEPEGAFTGEISAPMLRDAGATHVIIGHSERRHIFGETDEQIARKLAAAQRAGLTSILCMGESLKERESDQTDAVLERQCRIAFSAIRDAVSGGPVKPSPAETVSLEARLAIAYEPVWAIGTGKTATPQLASEAHRRIRLEVAEAFGDEAALNIQILYGGSVKPENVTSLMSEEEIDGALVGGASLDARSFGRIINY